MVHTKSPQLNRNRVVGNSEAGRRLRAQNSPIHHGDTLSPDIIEWNNAVAAKKEMKRRLKSVRNIPSSKGLS